MPRRKKEYRLTVGRPLIPIDWKEVDKLLIAGCIGTEIAAKLNMHPATLYDRCEAEHGINFSAYRLQKLAHGDALLREKIFKHATEGDRLLMIWLSKQRLGYRDKPLDENPSVVFNVSVTEIPK